jgi:hypothetical protein
MHYTYATLDPRPQFRAAMLELIAGQATLGVVVTIPELAAACSLGNIDPQHSGAGTLAAIDEAISYELPPDGTQLVTMRADLDSIGAMAMLEFRAEERGFTIAPDYGWNEAEQREIEDYASACQRIRALSTVDAGAYQRIGRISAYSRRYPWQSAGLRALAELGALIGDPNRSSTEKVTAAMRWIARGTLI